MNALFLLLIDLRRADRGRSRQKHRARAGGDAGVDRGTPEERGGDVVLGAVHNGPHSLERWASLAVR